MSIFRRSTREHEDPMANGDQYVPHLSLVWGGTFFGTETWQMGVRMSNPGIGTDQTGDEWCADKLSDVVTDISSWWDGGQSGQSSYAHLEWVKFNAIGADGKYVNKHETHQARVSPAVIPSAYPNVNTRNLPPQCALVLSLRTGFRGPREAWGHIYMPCVGVQTVTDQPYIRTVDTDAIASDFRDFIVALNDWPGVDPPNAPQVIIASKYSSYVDRRSGVAKTFQASNTPVTDVWVGNLIDTHRSRRKQLKETYSKVAL